MYIRQLSILLIGAVLVLMAGPLLAASVLVNGEWLAKNLNEKNMVIVDMTTVEMQYQRFHIPGAVYLPYRALVTKRKDGISVSVGEERVTQILGSLGIDSDKHVVIYDDMGGLDAGRLFWELERLGHKKVSVLDGGLVRWVLDGYKVDNKPVKTIASSYQKVGQGRNNGIEIDGVQAALQAKDAVLLDVRSEREFLGHPRRKRSGHIPGATLWSWDQSVDFENGFQLKQPEELLTSLKTKGVDPDKPIITFCRSGHRAAQNYLMLRHLGFEQVKLFDGSMSEWERRIDLPLKVGS